MSEQTKIVNDILTPKLRDLQLKLIEKRYGPLAAIFVGTIFKGELSKIDLRRSEAVLERLSRYHRVQSQFSRKFVKWRRWFVASLRRNLIMVAGVMSLILLFLVAIYFLGAL